MTAERSAPVEIIFERTSRTIEMVTIRLYVISKKWIRAPEGAAGCTQEHTRESKLLPKTIHRTKGINLGLRIRAAFNFVWTFSVNADDLTG